MAEKFMQEITSSATTLADTDLVLVTTNVSTTPVSKKITAANLRISMSRTYKVDNFGSLTGTQLLTMDISTAASSLGVMVNMILTGYDYGVLAIYNGYAYCRNSGTSFVIGDMDVFKTIFAGATAPFMTWEGTGNSRTLYLWNNQAYSQIVANVTASGYNSSPTFL